MKELIEKLPKNDLHLHIDGSIRIPTMIELAKEQKVELPSYTEEGINELLFKDSYKDLVEYLETFNYSCAVMQTPEAVERIAYELALDCQAEGVRYIEVRLDAILFSNSKQSSTQALESIDKGFQRAKKEYNQKPEIQQKKEPPFEYALILGVLRFLGAWSERYKYILESFPSVSNKEITKLISLEQAYFARKMKEKGLPVVAFDLAGAEKGHPCEDFIDAFTIAHQGLLHKTVHAGEAEDFFSIFEAVRFIQAERIGHGFNLFQENSPRARDLWNYFINKRITVEVCLTSNLQTIPSIQKISNHSYKKMLEKNISVVINTDNRTVSKTSMTKELLLAREGHSFTAAEFKDLVLNGFDKSFFPYPDEKKEYYELCNQYYDSVVKGTELEVSQ